MAEDDVSALHDRRTIFHWYSNQLTDLRSFAGAYHLPWRLYIREGRFRSVRKDPCVEVFELGQSGFCEFSLLTAGVPR